MVDSTLQDGPCCRMKQVRKKIFPLHRLLLCIGLGVMMLLSCGSPTLAAEAKPTDAQAWLAEWVAQGTFEQAWLDALLSPLQPDQRVLRLMDAQAEAKPYYLYRKNFINQQRIQRGRQQMRKHHAVLQQIQQQYHVPPEIVVALWGIESDFGHHSGGFSVLRALYTLATHYPRRANFFRDELRHFLLLCQEEGWDPNKPEGSFAGAIGQMQMMPSTLRQYAVDFDGDGKRDVFHNTSDVLASIASFLVGHHWKPDGVMSIRLKNNKKIDMESMVSPSLSTMRPWEEWEKTGLSVAAQEKNPDPNEPAALISLEEQKSSRYYMVFKNFEIITQWNRSRRFAMVVQELAEALRKKG